ncbi:DUF1364 domain-containing protein [Halomonas elongata]|nr:DUF1364 domain-containing protein [Halomonas elongata]
MFPRLKPYRSRAWLANVHEIENCVLCGRPGVQAAHSNQERGMSQKASDCLTAALCSDCHGEIDNGRDMNRDERRARMNDAIVRTLDQLARRGLVRAV